MDEIDGEKIRILLADDSFFIRHYLLQLFEQQKDIEVVGVANDGEEVVALARSLKPDVITMDYHMPNKNGIEATAEIMLGGRPLPAIIMLSAFDGQDGKEVRNALLASGAEVLVKPSGEVSLDIEKAAHEIVARVRQVGKTELKLRKMFEAVHGKEIRNVKKGSSAQSPLIVVLGASTGGPPLVEHLLSALSPNSDIAIVIVQHMSPYFTELFAERLDRVTQFSVREAVNGDMPIRGTALVVPGGMYLVDSQKDGVMATNGFVLKQGEYLGEIMIDSTMTAIAHMYKQRVCGILLSGMGSDGAAGMKQIKNFGGHTVVQNPDDAVVSTMPLQAIETTDIDAVLSVDKIPEYITQLSKSKNLDDVHDIMGSDGKRGQ